MGFAKASTHPTDRLIDKTMDLQRTVVMAARAGAISQFQFHE
jgi:hypothetical protein